MVKGKTRLHLSQRGHRSARLPPVNLGPILVAHCTASAVSSLQITLVWELCEDSSLDYGGATALLLSFLTATNGCPIYFSKYFSVDVRDYSYSNVPIRISLTKLIVFCNSLSQYFTGITSMFQHLK